MPAPRNRRHIVVGTAPQAESFTPHTSGRAPVFTRPSDLPRHAAVLKLALEIASTEAVERRQHTPLTVEGAHPGRYIDFEGPPGVDLKIDSLDLQGSGIEVVAVQPRREADQTATAQRATVFIPDGKQLAPALVVVGDLAELRRAKTSTAFFADLSPAGQPPSRR